MRLNYPRTILLSSAFCGLQALFAIYNAYVPILLQAGRADFNEARALEGFGQSTTMTGFIMTLDNLAALLILPFIGALSDVTTGRMGKRKPYIVIGAPITGIAFTLLPWMIRQPLWLFVVVVMIVILAVNVIRTPIFALMPDITPSPFRSQANGLVNLIGGIGAIAGFLVGGALYRQSITAPFSFGAVALLTGCLAVVALLPVPSSSDAADMSHARTPRRFVIGNPGVNILQNLRRMSFSHDHSLLYLLGTIFCLFLAFSVLTVFWTSFAAVTLQAVLGQEAQLLSIFALAVVVFALPAGFLGTRLGRKRTIMVGIAIFTVATTPIAILTNFDQIRVLLTVSGLGWSLIVVNAFPMVLDSTPIDQRQRIGTYTGLYFLATQAAEVIGPVLTGGLLDIAGRDYRLIFGVTLFVSVGAAVLLARVRQGEPYSAIVNGPAQEQG